MRSDQEAKRRKPMVHPADSNPAARATCLHEHMGALRKALRDDAYALRKPRAPCCMLDRRLHARQAAGGRGREAPGGGWRPPGEGQNAKAGRMEAIKEAWRAVKEAWRLVKEAWRALPEGCH